MNNQKTSALNHAAIISACSAALLSTLSNDAFYETNLGLSNSLAIRYEEDTDSLAQTDFLVQLLCPIKTDHIQASFFEVTGEIGIHGITIPIEAFNSGSIGFVPLDNEINLDEITFDFQRYDNALVWHKTLFERFMESSEVGIDKQVSQGMSAQIIDTAYSALNDKDKLQFIRKIIERHNELSAAS